jgi:alpha-1,2-mannosyltransferase
VYSDIATTHSQLFKQNHDVKICTAEEWYRFPSHYWLPDNSTLAFVKSDFKGILPKHFQEDSKTNWYNRPGTHVVPSGMNDENREEPDRYVSLCRKLLEYLSNYEFRLMKANVSSLLITFLVTSFLPNVMIGKSLSVIRSWTLIIQPNYCGRFMYLLLY